VRIQAMYRGHIARKLQRGSRALRVERKAHDNTATTIEVAMDLCGGKLGFSIRETLVGPRMDGRGVAISRVIPGESADRTGILQVGMPLLAINGVQIPDRGPKGTKHAAVRMIKQAGASLVLTCGTDLAKPTLSMQTVAKMVGLGAASSPAAKATPIPESDTPTRTSTRTPPHLSVPDY
jgi:C-terminal processing protease CtpA/Prc